MHESARKAALADEYWAIRNEAKKASGLGDIDLIVEGMKEVTDKINDWRHRLLVLVASEQGVEQILLEAKHLETKSADLYLEYLTEK